MAKAAIYRDARRRNRNARRAACAALSEQRAVRVDVDLEIAYRVCRVLDEIGHAAKARGNAARAAVRVIRRLVDEGAEFIQLRLKLREHALRELHLNVRLHLPADTADILPAIDRAAVFAARNKAAASARDTADVIAHMLIADNRAVFAAPNGSRVIARDTTGIERGKKRAAGGQLRHIE